MSEEDLERCPGFCGRVLQPDLDVLDVSCGQCPRAHRSDGYICQPCTGSLSIYDILFLTIEVRYRLSKFCEKNSIVIFNRRYQFHNCMLVNTILRRSWIKITVVNLLIFRPVIIIIIIYCMAFEFKLLLLTDNTAFFLLLNRFSCFASYIHRLSSTSIVKQQSVLQR